MKQIINCETGEITNRDLTQDEIDQAAIDAEMVAKIKSNSKDKTEAKTALLERIGITADEAAMLLQ